MILYWTKFIAILSCVQPIGCRLDTPALEFCPNRLNLIIRIELCLCFRAQDAADKGAH